jgi:general secretion pathway protein D
MSYSHSYMIVKTFLITCFLACLGAWAQSPPPPASSHAPAAGTNFTAVTNLAGTNHDEMLRQALRRSLAGRTNASALTNSARLAPQAGAPGLTNANTNQDGTLRQAMHRAGTAAGTNVPPPLQTPLRPVPPGAAPASAGAPALVPPSVTAGSPSAQPLAAPGAAMSPANRSAGVTPSATAGAPPDDMLPPGMIDFRGADLKQVLDVYSMMVNRTLLRPANLPTPTIDLKTQGRLTMAEGIQALKAVLSLNGISVIDVDEKFAKVVPATQAGQEGAPFSKQTADQLPSVGQYVTEVVQLRYVKPSEIVPVLTPFQKLPNAIMPVETSQIVVLRDNAENVKRMLEMISKIDIMVPTEFTSEVIPIKYALSSDIASALNSLSSGGSGGSVGSSSRGRTGTTSMSSRTGGTGMGGTGMGGYPGAAGSNPMGGTSPQGTTAPGAGNNFTQRLQNIISKAATSGEIQILGQTKIISDERTNSLLVWASHEDMKVIKDIIAKLDIVLAQVLIEAVILSVELDKSQNLGVSYLQNTPTTFGKWNGQGAGGAGTFLNNSSFSGGSGSNAVSALGGGFNYVLGYGNDLDVTVTALEANSHAKILQRPRIQTSNAKQASLFVGESRPYPTGSYYGGGSYGSYSSIQQLQIGVSIDVTPLINVDGLVVMDIHQKIDSFEGNVTIQGVGDVPITSSKEAQASVAVRDHDTIMLGGMIETDKNDSKSGVPLLMDIPLLGNLFRSTSTSETRSELIVLIRPTVLPTPEVAALTATSEKNKMPGVRTFEREDQVEAAKELRRVNKEIEKSSAPDKLDNP